MLHNFTIHAQKTYTQIVMNLLQPQYHESLRTVRMHYRKQEYPLQNTRSKFMVCPKPFRPFTVLKLLLDPITWQNIFSDFHYTAHAVRINSLAPGPQ